MTVQNLAILEYGFLKEMYEDSYFPNDLVEKIQTILVEFCIQIENQHPQNLDHLYVLSHQATEKINQLQDAFEQADSEIETVARECIAEDFGFIADSYAFEDADIEELIAPRDW